MQDSHYPPEYTLGKVIFFGREFLVNPDVLIPRLETEGLVRRARALIREEAIDTVMDIGTGSGIIGVSCADLPKRVVFVDISEKVLETARENFMHHFSQKEASFVVSDLFHGLRGEGYGRIMVLANLPYIREDDWVHMSPDTRHEPRLALFGGEKTGFELYTRFFRELFEFQKNHTVISCFIEFGYDQKQICQEILQEYPCKYQFFADFAGIERFCEIRLTNI